ncbi:MAG: spore coat protein CotJB [Bacilli bacterium]|nr:spore coat protein CotJB [Bacilli bacterium]
MYYDERDNKIKYINEEKKIENNDYDYNLKNHEHNDVDLTNFNIKKNDYDFNNYMKNDVDLNKYNIKNEFEKNNYQNNYKSNEWDTDVKVNIGNINVNNMRKDELYTAKEGLNKGNMFTNIYDPYKNYIYKVIVSGEKDELLLRIQELTFKLIDLGLYLDINAKDEKIYYEFRNASKELKKAKEMYEKNYGPLCLTETEYYSEYKWNKNPWPWMNEGGKN